MGAEDDAWRAAIRNAKYERLQLLLLQEARNGRSTPPEVVMEIAATRRELGMAESLVQAKVGVEFAQEVGGDGQFLILTQMLDGMGQRVELLATTLGERIDRVEDEQHARDAAQDLARAAGQRRTRLVLAIVGLLLLVLIGAVIWIGATLRAHGF
jgi:hypothetical protein